MKSRLGDLPHRLVLCVLGALTLFPIYFVLTNSFKSQVEYARSPLGLPGALQPENYAAAWGRIAGPMLNSSVIVLTSVLAILALASLSAYAFALMEFPGRTALFGLVFYGQVHRRGGSGQAPIVGQRPAPCVRWGSGGSA